MASQLKRDYFWNSAAGIMVSASTIIMLLAVTRVAGIAAAGIFSIATAIGQQFQVLGNYEIRTYQATDVRHRFSFGTYHATRIITVLLMVIAIVIYPIVGGRVGAELLAIIAVASIRVLDAYEDVFLGEFQRLGRLDTAGKINFFRVLATTAIFTVAVALTDDLLVSSLITIGISAIIMAALIIPPARQLFPSKPEFSHSPIVALLRACLPLFLAIFLSLYLSNAPRFAIESFLDSEHQGYFAILFMPAFTINLLSTLMFRPLLTHMAEEWATNNRQAFHRLIVRGLQGAGVSFVVTFLATLLCGVPLLNLLYGVDLAPYRNEMLVLVFGGALNALSIVLYYALSTMRRQNAAFLGYALASVVVLVLSRILVVQFGIMGASLAYVAAMITLTVSFFVSLSILEKR